MVRDKMYGKDGCMVYMSGIRMYGCVCWHVGTSYVRRYACMD